MLKFLLRLLVAVVGFAIGLFCLLLASVGAVRLYGWSQTGRLAPPHFPGLEKFDIISFATDPLRAFMELGGNAFLVVISLSGFVAVILTFRRGVAWWQDWPAVLPMSLVLVFLAAISATLVDRTDWVLPASLLSAFIATGYQWIVLRKQGLPFTARYADEVAAFRQNAPASAQKPSWLGLAAAALMTLLAVMKLVHHVR